MSVKDIKQSLLKVSNYLEVLETQLDERNRLVSILNLNPSSNDNLELVSNLDRIKKNLNYLQNDINNLKTPSNDLVNELTKLINLYNTSLTNIVDCFFDINDYKLEVNLNSQTKSVRFKDDDNELRNELMGTQKFQPYHDDEQSLESISNHEFFAQHQQTILQQDSHLDSLHESIQFQKNLGHNINSELDDHIILLNDLEQGVDSSHTRLNQTHRRLNVFRNKVRENGSLVTIIILTVILILLLVVLN
ncbi:hypothetical protein HYPBUDRAFT_12034 [Hyphopichia burtonii NRRL Y-1933]|uniref:t-SNARE coiled-coil homology domain-containing protein n=1 Tax=Hyphopichia burtonii NRRL Y-1933 TaxID=984485 RepID=A0A1E4RGT2_9ASCO|nr:hypothetical protein HYPBUDRAFT_12034 [Hyphopichia burtonii NRRL Y-1933]ODV66325.1 hypothetical protein HYPBUDRAFT_12034 [Hyphopichia burtonii NRRL Y-1933]